MKRIIGLLIVCAGPVLAQPQTRDFQLPCMSVFPVAARIFTSAHWEPTLSDSAGGLLTMKYTGTSLIPARAKMDTLKAVYAKYIAGKWIYGVRDISWSQASLTFVHTTPGCSVSIQIKPAVWDYAKWSLVPSNGTAEREMLDAIAAQMQ